MSETHYVSGAPARVGDEVVITQRRFFGLLRARRHGRVTCVFDPTQPRTRFGSNDGGVTIHMAPGNYLWLSELDSSVVLVTRQE